MSTVEVVLPRPRGRALVLATMTLWLPCLAPLVLGLLNDSSGNFSSYLTIMLAVPGMFVPVMMQLDDGWFGVMAVLVTFLALLGLYVAVRKMPRLWLHALQTLVMVLVGLEAFGIALAIRA